MTLTTVFDGKSTLGTPAKYTSKHGGHNLPSVPTQDAPPILLFTLPSGIYVGLAIAPRLRILTDPNIWMNTIHVTNASHDERVHVPLGRQPRQPLPFLRLETALGLVVRRGRVECGGTWEVVGQDRAAPGLKVVGGDTGDGGGACRFGFILKCGGTWEVVGQDRAALGLKAGYFEVWWHVGGGGLKTVLLKVGGDTGDGGGACRSRYASPLSSFDY
ncbi:hypothetical protein NLI96_g7321 [Meripilus lineatus]|uniref:Uncharacterized protein n=1 Tax=Meripilus lineatus TaxID=2056292 RepID=A0AAD5UZM5_9APHY|nr:hypothetical protein NLI96_g7321 [Physisporinus lineatus]